MEAWKRSCIGKSRDNRSYIIEADHRLYRGNRKFLRTSKETVHHKADVTVDVQKEEFGTQAEDTILNPPNTAQTFSDVTQNTATLEPKRERIGEAMLKIKYFCPDT